MDITDEQYAEYRQLKRMANFDSALNYTDRLENDIDAPIKDCVAMLALLGCEPTWSCCGFDYYGQPRHKKHEYGTVGFCLAYNPRTNWLRYRMDDDPPPYNLYTNRWQWSNPFKHYDHAYQTLFSSIEAGNTWPQRDCIHYSEPAVIAIAALECYLRGFQLHFSDVTLTDSNFVFKQRFPCWQYPPKMDWEIRAIDYRDKE